MPLPDCTAGAQKRVSYAMKEGSPLTTCMSPDSHDFFMGHSTCKRMFQHLGTVQCLQQETCQGRAA